MHILFGELELEKQIDLLQGIVYLLFLLAALVFLLLIQTRKSRPRRIIQTITMKRKHIHLTGLDPFGHWWFEIGNPNNPVSESYGWWPAIPFPGPGGWLLCLRAARGRAARGQTDLEVFPQKLLNRSDLAPRNSGKENRYNRETFQMEPCG